MISSTRLEVMQMKFIPHDYQKFAMQKLVEMPEAGLFLDMGLG